MNNNTPIQIERITPNVESGLTSQQVALRLKYGLNNKVKQKYSKSYLNIFLDNVCTFFNLLGLIVFIALLAIKSSPANFFFVFFYVANTSIGIIQELRAKACIDKLSILACKTTKTVRDNAIVDIPSNEIVLDDVLYLGLGNQIPTDCIILEGQVEVNEALLTGESVPVKKNEGDRLLAGSFITSGNCYVHADVIGADNYVETLSSKAKEYKKPHSEIMGSIKQIIKAISFVIIPIATAFIIKSIVAFNTPIDVAIEGASTVVIGMIPAGMMLLTSVALAIGIIKLAKHNTLVQDLYSLETLARVDTICFDKTGTITDGKMSVNQVITLDKSENVNEIMSSMIGTLKDTNQTAIALENHFGNSLVLESTKALPFNSSRKLSAVTFTDKTYAFGAPEFVLSKDEYEKIKKQINKFTTKGYRVLVVARSNGSIINDNLPKDFMPTALIIIADNIRQDAIDTIKWFNENKVEIKVISGDNPITVAEVSARVGIPNADKYISLEGLTDQEVFDSATKYSVFGRVSPEQKAILIKALKSSGHVTAMTGDGVNDILALKEADCAISVASGSDAARNVSHLVLLNNNFNSMPKVVYEGRRVINNVQSSASLFLMKTFFTMLMSIITLCLPYLQTYPFRLPQMILLEMFVIGTPATLLAMQPNDSLVEGKFISYVIKKSIPAALTITLSVLIVEIIKLTVGVFPDYIYTTMSVVALTLAGCISLFSACKPFNKFRTILYIGNVLIVLIVILTHLFGAGILSAEYIAPMIPLNTYWHHWLIMFGIFLLDIPLFFGLKILFEKITKTK